ncbi:coiled-coil domain-containing protein 42-like [Alosa sapidissima]|uniref:coiled-coil domain-containing protein 42-like n=1 Tax=Alosa sapidissima TaxID=34773 RepID=UPI001C089944|nr:coiled-coil domain-containing protein 42-like [Alosa sapidissima]
MLKAFLQFYSSTIMDAKNKANDLAAAFNNHFKNNLQHQLLGKQSEDFAAPATRLLKKKQEENDVHQAMLAVKEDFNMTARNRRLRREELKVKEAEIKGHLLKFDQFLKENEMKRVRAMKKAENERKLALQKAIELRALEVDLQVLTEERDRLARLAKKNEIYLDYMLKVVRLCKQFDEPRQVMPRFDTLVQTREDLLQNSKEGEASVNQALTQQAHYIEQSQDRIINYNNKLALLQTELDTVTSHAMLWESKWVHIQNTAAKKTLLLGTIKMATLNLFVSMCGKDKRGMCTEDTGEQLSQIQSFLLNLISIMEELHKAEHK